MVSKFYKYLIFVILSLSIIAIVSTTLLLGRQYSTEDHFTEFYVLGQSKKAFEYPIDMMVGESKVVILGIRNYEYRDESYKIEIKSTNMTIKEIYNISISHNETIELEYTLIPQYIGENIKIKFYLYKENSNESYRDLYLLITVRPGEEDF